MRTIPPDELSASCMVASAVSFAVSMAVYDAVAFPFDPAVDQRLLNWTACGAGAAGALPVTGGDPRPLATVAAITMSAGLALLVIARRHAGRLPAVPSSAPASRIRR